uniref:Olfactory receptor n=1 Tax=Gopherus evgoodei TaxID=1825980 RepID=A0A8C4WTE9_9SAUR
MENHTTVAEFILVGFGGHPELQVFLSVFFLVLYTVTLVGNVGMITIISADSRLHTPMYFFLKNLSFLDLCYSSVTAPNALLCFLMGRRAISYNGCAAQMFFFSLFGTTEAFFLAVMAYDRFVAICNPLRYPITMSKRTCAFLVAVGSWLVGFLASMLKVIFISQLSFCRANVINHFFCDISPLLNMACTDMTVAQIVDFILALFILLVPLSIIFVSYVCIIGTILRIPTTQGKRKAFSTCTSHLTVVVIFFSATLFMYARPKRIHPFDLNKLVSVVYTIVTPMLNPFIYCLRNQEVKGALRRAFSGVNKMIFIFL